MSLDADEQAEQRPCSCITCEGSFLAFLSNLTLPSPPTGVLLLFPGIACPCHRSWAHGCSIATTGMTRPLAAQTLLRGLARATTMLTRRTSSSLTPQRTTSTARCVLIRHYQSHTHIRTHTRSRAHAYTIMYQPLAPLSVSPQVVHFTDCAAGGDIFAKKRFACAAGCTVCSPRLYSSDPYPPAQPIHLLNLSTLTATTYPFFYCGRRHLLLFSHLPSPFFGC